MAIDVEKLSEDQIDDYLDDMMATPGWQLLVDELQKEIYQQQSNVLEVAASWDEVLERRGWCKALAYIANLREIKENARKAAQGELDYGDA